MSEPLEVCPWTTGSQRKRFYRVDWYRSPDCRGCDACLTGNAHQCHVHGLIMACTWPNAVTMSNYTEPYWWPHREAGLAEGWILPTETKEPPKC